MMRIKNNDIRFDNFNYWPKSIKRMMLIFISISVIILGLLFESHLLSSIKTIHQQTINLEQTLNIKKNSALQAQGDLQQLTLLQKKETELTLTLPEKPDLTGIIQSLSDSAEQNNIVFQTLEPLPEMTGTIYQTLPAHGVMVGNYKQLGSFINDILQISRLINVGDFTLQSSGKGDFLNLDFTLMSYYYAPNADRPHHSPPPQAGEGIIQKGTLFIFSRDPFLPVGNETASSQCLFCDASIHELKMNGTLTVDGKLWALIQSPAEVSAVKVGDKIGDEQISILTITHHSVVLSNHLTIGMKNS